ncbi:hypothetical protein RND71_017878 [Anisodus tanguticus]|uniref:HAT C-terminal dimerisation domain-containing protein n=1 Tax=Anisodus tanguticus TaxID=243964 RepID=A0AAE1S3N2_9SOLA|nr:hypothetical protein RND71_017878 [Anisodus tanguticus]
MILYPRMMILMYLIGGKGIKCILLYRKLPRTSLQFCLFVASESAFSMGGMVISSHRSRLHFKTVEALMCLQNWMIEDIKGTLEGTHACSIVTEDYEEEGEVVDYIDMDVDDVETSDFED